MKTPIDQKHLPAALGPLYRDYQMPTKASGNTLLYILVLLVIFSVLGLSMASLFSTSSTSSATPNDARRALYMAESAMRYAFSELRNSGFDTDLIDTLNSRTYNVKPEGNFELNIFAPWFVAPVDQIVTGGGALTLNVPAGELTPGWLAKDPGGVWVLNYEYVDKNEVTARDPVVSWTKIDATTLSLTVTGDITVNADERVCLVVKPKQDQPGIIAGGDLLVMEEARNIFPERNGAISINRIHYVYEQLIHDPANSQAILKNISDGGMPNTGPAFPLNVSITESGGDYIGDFIVLSPQNYIVFPTGQSEDVSHGGDLDAAINIYNRGVPPPPLSRAPDIDAEELTSNLSKVDDSNFIVADTDADTINVGGGVPGADFGAGWYEGNKSIGGSTDFCLTGACRFGLGVRAFFIIDYSPQGEGFTFTMSNSVDNDTTSVGGDIQLPELLAFAGDSRLVVNPADTLNPAEFLDAKGQGILPPKLALEFDVRENSGVQSFCLDAANLKEDTRNDPNEALFVDLDLTPDDKATDRDVLQYVYWGNNATLLVPCRSDGNPLSYDDNRHDPAATATDNWTFKAGDNVESSPAVSSDGTTIYFGSNDDNLYAVNSDGTLQWKFPDPAGKVKSSPAISSDGTTIYFGSEDTNFYAVNSDGTLQWKFPNVDKVNSSPAISSDGTTIYFGSEDDNLYAVNSDGTLQWKFPNPTDKVKSSPAIDRTGGPHDGTIYVGSDDGNLYAINPNGTLKWGKPAGDKVESSPVVAADGTIYVGSETGKDKGKVLAFDTAGNILWDFNTVGKVKTRPTISANGNTIYVGTESNRVYALDVADREAGENFPTKTEWEFLADGKVKTSPVIGGDSIYVGSDGGKGEGILHAIHSFAFPRNERGTLITYSEEMGSDFDTQDKKDNWMNQNDYAVRLEVMRSATANPDGNFEYNLRTWIRRCQTVNCPDADITGTFFQDTRIEYAWFPAPNSFMEQTIELSAAEHAKMERFLFGFTGATAAGDTQSVLIKQFQLSFIRPNDPIVTDDSVNYPVP